MLKFIQNYFYKRSLNQLSLDLRNDINIAYDRLYFQTTYNELTHTDFKILIYDLIKLYSNCFVNINDTNDQSLKTILIYDPNQYNKLSEHHKECMRTEILIHCLKSYSYQLLNLNKFYQLRNPQLMKELKENK